MLLKFHKQSFKLLTLPKWKYISIYSIADICLSDIKCNANPFNTHVISIYLLTHAFAVVFLSEIQLAYINSILIMIIES